MYIYMKIANITIIMSEILLSLSSLQQEYCLTVGDLCKKWNSFCSSGQKNNPHFAEKPFQFSSLSSPPSNSFSSHHCNNLGLFDQSHHHKSAPKEYQFWVLENSEDGYESNVKMLIPERNIEEPAKPELLSNPNSSPNSASSSEVMEEDPEELKSFKEINSENLRILCDEMEKNVPWQKEIIPEIVTTVLQCRSGMSQRKGGHSKRDKGHEEKDESCWLFFLGGDSTGKEKIAKTLAKLIFGSQNNFVAIGLSSFSSSSKNKRARDESGCSYVQRFGEAVNENPRRVFFMEDLEEVDYCSQNGIKQAIDSGRVTLPGGETVPLKDAIVVFSCESFFSVSRPARSPATRTMSSQKSDHHHHATIKKKDDDHDINQRPDDMKDDKRPGVSLDLNIAVDDDHDEDSDSINVGILESVDRRIIFKVQEL